MYPNSWSWATSLGLCVRASPDRAERCLRHLEKDRATDHFNGTISQAYESYVDGAKSYVRGDHRAAARAWKRVDPTDNFYPLIVAVSVFDEIGAAAEASVIDTSLMAHKTGTFRGATKPHVREATRAAKRGDKKRAAELAAIVVQAWGKADVAIPALEPMRALL